MKNPKKCIGAAALLLLASSASAEVLQESEPGARQTPGLAPEASLERLDIGEVVGGRAAAGSLETLQQRLADCLVVLQTSGDTTAAATYLDALWLEASSVQPYDGQAVFLAELALARSEVLEREGRLEAAREVLRAPLIAQGHELHRSFPDRLVAFEGKDARALVREIVRHPRIQKRWNELGRRVGQSESDTLAQIVTRAYDIGDYSTIRAIGPPAFEPLAEIVLAEPETFVAEVTKDPLWNLMAIDLRRTGEVVRGTFDRGGYLWKRRIVRCVAEFVKRGPRPDGPWFEIYGRLAADPETFLQLLPSLERYGNKNGGSLSMELARALTPALRTCEASAGRQLLESFWFRSNAYYEVTAPMVHLLEAGLAHADVRVRAYAAAALAKCTSREEFARNQALLQCYQDTDAGVRTSVAWGLHNTPDEVPFTDLELRALRSLVQDEEQSVRDPAVGALLSRIRPSSEPILWAAAEKASYALAESLVRQSDQLPAGLQGRLLEQLTANGSEELLSLVDGVLNESNGPIETAPDAFLPVILQRLHSGAANLDPNVLVGATRNASDTSPLAEFAVLTRDSDLIRALHAWWGLRNYGALEEDTLVELLGLLYGADSQMTLWEGWQERPRMLRRLIASNEHERLSLMAAELLGRRGDPADLPLFSTLLGQIQDPNSVQAVEATLRHYDDQSRNAFLLQLLERHLADPGAMQEFLVLAASRTIARNGPHVARLSGWVLDRWPLQEDVNALWHSLRLQGSLGEEANAEALERAVRAPRLDAAALSAIEELRDGRFVQLLGDCLVADWLPNDTTERRTEREMLQRRAAGALSMLLSDEAAEQLLRGLSVPNPKVREACLAGLEHIEVARREMERVRNARAPLPTRESALAELAAMLEHEDPGRRVMAIEGIVAFGALEYLPTLIGRLDAEIGEVHNALLAAIDALTERGVAPPAEKESNEKRPGERARVPAQD